uniref:F-box associated domain-containing protein n=1 Tax=Panagrolaimus sp. JU765 TaxID=591449 RepID=A0AC34RKM5_9BILA
MALKVASKLTAFSLQLCKDDYLPFLPAIRIDSLETDNLGRCLEAFGRSLCTVRYLDVDGKGSFRLNHLLRNQVVLPGVEVILINWAFRKKFKPMFDALQQRFPDLKKVEIFCSEDFHYYGDNSVQDDEEEVYGGIYNEVGDMESFWNKMKQDMEDASPQEIMINIHLFNISEKNKEVIECLHGEEIDQLTYRWTSQKNNLKTIKLWHHR